MPTKQAKIDNYYYSGLKVLLPLNDELLALKLARLHQDFEPGG